MAANKNKSPESAVEAKPPKVFRKENILRFKRYAGRRDLLSVLLDAEQEYTLEQVDTLMDNTVKTSPRLEAFLNLKKMRSKASPLLAGRLGIFGIYYFNWLKHPTILIHQTQLQVKQGASLLLLQKQACVFS